MDALLHQYDQHAHLLKLSSPLLAATSDMAFAATDPNNNDDFDPPTPTATTVVIKPTPPPSTTTTTTTSSKEDKYSLRPRSMRRVTEVLTDPKEPAATTTSTTTTSTLTIASTPAPAPTMGSSTKARTKSHKPKQKPAPLSKYRRKTANARERNRMREINQAFETLRQVIPQKATHTPSPNEKLTKITTLRLAMKYISSLSAALSENSSGSHLENAFFLDPSFGSDCGDLDCLLLESDGESLPLSDHSSLLASPDFPETSLSPVDFGDPNSLSPFLQTDYDHSDFSDFLLT